MAFPGPSMAATLFLAFSAGASAQGPLTTPAARAALVRDAFDSAYGKALIAELGKSLRRDADHACLQAKGLQDGELEERGHDLLVKWGTSSGERMAAFFDMKAYAERFQGTDELKQLEQDGDGKQYL